MRETGLRTLIYAQIIIIPSTTNTAKKATARQHPRTKKSRQRTNADTPHRGSRGLDCVACHSLPKVREPSELFSRLIIGMHNLPMYTYDV